jgi:2,5-diketo-D-gluconate reductase A
MPQLGLGVFRLPPAETASLVRAALTIGYTAVDTAAVYRNEQEVGEAVRSVSEPIFVTTKIWVTDFGTDATPRAFAKAMDRLGLDWIDLLLLHWPTTDKAKRTEAWRALMDLRDGERLRSIGVSNFTVGQLSELIAETGVVPAVNQVELHPYYQQRELRAFHAEHAIATTSWAPLGRGAVEDAAIIEIGDKHGKTPAQVIIRWHLESGLIVIPKTANRNRLPENLDVFDFELDGDDMASFAKLDRADGRTGPDPETFDG